MRFSPKPIRPVIGIPRNNGGVALNPHSDQARGLLLWLPCLPPVSGGAKIQDYLGRYHGTLENGSIAASSIGSAVDFNGTNTKLTLTGFTIPDVGSESLWVYLRTGSSGVGAPVFIHSGAHYFGGDNELSYFGNYAWQSSATGVIGSGRWCHVVLTHTASETKIYADGINVLTYGAGLLARGSDTNIGYRSDFPTPPSMLNGQIADVRFYNYVLPERLIAQMAAASTRWELYRPAAPRLMWVPGQGATDIPASESGLGTDTPILAPSLATAEATFPASEGFSCLASLSRAENGAGNEAILLAQQSSASESGVGTDAANLSSTIPAAETGAGIELLTLQAAATAAETGAGAEALALTQFYVSGETGAGAEGVLVSPATTVAETGAGTEATTLGVAQTALETGAGTDATPLSVTLTSVEAGAGSDNTLVQAIPVAAEGWSGAENAAVAQFAAIDAAETGAGTEAVPLTVSLATSETWTAGESLMIDQGGVFTVNESALGSEAVSLAVAVAVGEISFGAEGQTLSINSAAAETGIGAEAQSLGWLIAVGETGLGAESLSLTVAVASNDPGAGVDAVTLNPNLLLGELWPAGDSAALSIAITAAETGAGTEATQISAGNIIAATEAFSSAETVSMQGLYAVAETGAGVDVAQVTGLGAAGSTKLLLPFTVYVNSVIKATVYLD